MLLLKIWNRIMQITDKYLNTSKRKMFARTMIIAVLFAAALAYLLYNLSTIQLVENDEYRRKAFDQYTKEDKIPPERGTIYDRNMKPLAISATVENVCISPNLIEEDKRDLIYNYLVSMFDVNTEKLKEKLYDPKQTYYRVARRQERKVADEVRSWMKLNGISDGIHFEEEAKRYYPGGTLASHLLGFVNSENEGAYGIEAKYENVLKGVPGKVVYARNAALKKMPFDYESYIEPDNGTNIVLTIDESIQYFLENALEGALKDTKARNRVLGIVMDVNTGEILASSVKPDYDPNDPYMMDDATKSSIDAITDPKEKEEAVKAYRTSVWNNKMVNELYEPGSTFKLITAAIALEENKVTGSDRFYCSGQMTVAGIPIHCHKKDGHGSETFEEGLQNSCNPVFMNVAERIGKEKFYEYFEAFGCMDKTNIDLPGEASSIYHSNLTSFNQVELAVYSFGQTFKITPIQLLTAVSAVANGGKLMQPYVVKSYVDENGNTIESFEPKMVRQVISEDTSEKVMKYLAGGINVGSTKNAYVKGYEVAAKTGTSQKRDKINPVTGEKDLLIGSCVGFAPADDPQVAVLIIIDEPVGSYYGGVVAAPVVSQVLTDVLPYLHIAPELTEQEEASLMVSVSKYKELTLEQAKKAVTDDGFEYKVIGDGNMIVDQYPSIGSKVSKGAKIVLYTEDDASEHLVTVPNLLNMSASQVNKVLLGSNLNVSISGTYREGVSGEKAVSQNPAYGTRVPAGSVVEVTFKHTDGTD